MTSIHPYHPLEENENARLIVVTGQPSTSQPTGVVPDATYNTQLVEAEGLPPGTKIMPRPQPIPGVPPGLEYLTTIDQLLINQQVEFLEVFTSAESKNRYQIKNSSGHQIFLAAEESNLCMRFLFGTRRSFTLHITDNFGQEVIRVSREFKCCIGVCCCNCNCCVFELQVEAPVGNICGYVRQLIECGCTCSAAEYLLRDADRQDVLFVQGPCCICSGICCRCDQEFKVFTPDRSRMVGLLSKQYSGLGKELFTDASNFKVTFPIDLDVRMKAVTIAAAFLIDFMFFDGK